MEDLRAILEFVVQSVWNVWPVFLLSVLLGVLVRRLRLDRAIRNAFRGRAGWSILPATGVGAFSPFCSCTVVPVVHGLLASGIPLAAVMAFWIASPTMDPEIFALSVGTLGWPLAIARLVATLGVSLGAGYITLLLAGRLGLKEDMVRPVVVAPSRVWVEPMASAALPQPAMLQFAASPVGPSACVAAGTCTPQATTLDAIWRLPWLEVGRDVAAQAWQLGRWLVLAFVLEALITRYVPQAAVAAVLGGRSPWAVPLAAVVGIPLYLTNAAALPIVAGLLAQGMQPGAAIAFLIAGPVTTVPAMIAVWGSVRPRVFALYLAFGLFGAMAMGYLANVILGG